jgi:CxxC-x17-CxxC domain-containing protein
MARRKTKRPRKGPSRYKPRMHKVVCSVCEVELTVPVAPPPGKKLTCLKCLEMKNKQSE